MASNNEVQPNWLKEWNRALIIESQKFPRSISREDLDILKVNQLDGELLDAEILRQLNQYVVRMFLDVKFSQSSF